jgi:DNA invertase Pin-like site-specific DNA recombinase
MTIYGYARVSTGGQDLASQLDALKNAGAGKVWREKVSGAETDRVELAKLMKALQPGVCL